MEHIDRIGTLWTYEAALRLTCVREIVGGSCNILQYLLISFVASFVFICNQFAVTRHSQI